MQHVIIILFLFPFAAIGQSPERTKEQLRFDDSLERADIKKMDIFDLDKNGFPNQFMPDTIFYDNKKIRAVGLLAMDGKGNKSDYKVGKWTEYFENGGIKSLGDYQMDFVWACNGGFAALAYYYYKVGYWTYYYESGQIMATGKYRLKQESIFTGITGQFLKKPTITNKWLLYDVNGKLAANRQKIILALGKEE